MLVASVEIPSSLVRREQAVFCDGVFMVRHLRRVCVPSAACGVVPSAARAPSATHSPRRAFRNPPVCGELPLSFLGLCLCGVLTWHFRTGSCVSSVNYRAVILVRVLRSDI